MSLNDRMKRIFSTPSYRGDADYSKQIPHDAKYGAFLFYRDLVVDSQGHVAGLVVADVGNDWLHEVLRQFTHAHLEINQLIAAGDLSAHDPLHALSTYLMHDRTPSSHFLDFLELSLGPDHRGPSLENDFVDGLNQVLDQHRSPYLLTQYVYVHKKFNDGPFQAFSGSTSISAYPKAYLKQSEASQQHAIEPALRLLAGEAYAVPNQDFLKALDRQRNGDYDGVLTSCAATLEGTIKATAQARGLSIRGKGLGTLFQSFASKSHTVPDQLKTVINFLHERRSKAGDAHGHSAKDQISEPEAALFVALTASLASFLSAAK